MNIGIVGLGLIGGSLAGAFKKNGHMVLGSDSAKSTQDFARMAGTIDGVLDDSDADSNIKDCEVVFLAVPVSAAAAWLDDNSDKIAPGTLIIDCCGIKRNICRKGFDLAKKNNYTFVGGHPMAGKQMGGFKNSSPELFDGAFFAIVPNEENGDSNDINLMIKIQSILKDAGFMEFAVMTPEEHDQIIAFTSQMAHLISNAYIKSDMAEVGVGAALSGGAFKDMTRVAYLNEAMWTELFLENKDNLLSELNGFIGELERYREAIQSDDIQGLTQLLHEGKTRKQEIESR